MIVTFFVNLNHYISGCIRVNIQPEKVSIYCKQISNDHFVCPTINVSRGLISKKNSKKKKNIIILFVHTHINIEYFFNISIEYIFSRKTMWKLFLPSPISFHCFHHASFSILAHDHILKRNFRLFSHSFLAISHGADKRSGLIFTFFFISINCLINI